MSDSIIDDAGILFARLIYIDDSNRINIINEIRKELHKYSPFKNEPVDCIQWVQSEQIQANDYNPNQVAPPEMELLKLSILEDGYTQPIVAWHDTDHYEVIDGFHRNRVGKECNEITQRIKGYLPLTIVNENRTNRGDRIASTIRHNRARGKHTIDGMSDIVIELKRRNWTTAKISKQLGMDEDEILRLTQITGLIDVFSDREFTKSWEIGTIIDEHFDGELISDENIDIESNGNGRTYHTWDKWECYKAGFFETKAPDMTDDEAKEAYRQLLSDIPRFKSVMEKIIIEWKYSCEHNLSNTSLNRIAWLGQASLAYDMHIPACYRTGYHLLTEQQQIDANNAALEYLNKWLTTNGHEPTDLKGANSHLEVELY